MFHNLTISKLYLWIVIFRLETPSLVFIQIRTWIKHFICCFLDDAIDNPCPSSDSIFAFLNFEFITGMRNRITLVWMNGCLIHAPNSKLVAWWRHQMETFSALLAICAGNSPVPGEFPTQRPVTRRFDVYFDLRPNKRLSKQSWGWWFETLSCSLWRHRNEVLFAKTRSPWCSSFLMFECRSYVCTGLKHGLLCSWGWPCHDDLITW